MSKYDNLELLIRDTTNGEYEFIELDHGQKRSGKPTLRLRHTTCGGVFETTTHHFFNRGQRCCSRNRPLDHDTFVERVREHHGDAYEIVGRYTTKDATVEVVHRACGHRFFPVANNIMRGMGCRRCAGLLKKTLQELRDEVRALAGDEYSVVGDTLVNVDTKIDFLHRECGTVFGMRPNDFTSGGQRCPRCMQSSRGEDRIERWLTGQGLRFEREVRFPDCRDKMPLPFDFAVEDLFLVEFDGRQHYQADGRHTPRMLAATQRRDRIRNEYCRQRGYALLRIPYTHIDEVELILEHFLAMIQERSTTSAWHVEYKRSVLETGGTLFRGEDIVSSLRIHEGRAAA